ncbi:uncharacterized protein LOC130629140 isoform X1 [Hydractinia symbiolongicarpus]|uniref:uncharacterized protein LOC130629140 isoform X1 n=2 Tax=Hydractinia symbiolongicarpus TaxID=13093 RepID=UPI00254C73E5|nr:uncharacterized protein LOC130629140 isoform X1 [Hydractinia symbiolongicarpus]
MLAEEATMGKFNFENPFEVARRLSRTRSLSFTHFVQGEGKSRLRSDSEMFLRRRTDPNEYHTHENEQLRNKIEEWLSDTSSEFERKKGLSRKPSNNSVGESLGSVLDSDENDEIQSECSRRSSLDSPKKNSLSCQTKTCNYDLLPVYLQKEIEASDCVLEDVPWDLVKSDLLIQVDNVLFPVDRNFISYVSDCFYDCVENANQKGSHVLLMEGYDVNEVKTILKYIHSTNNDGVSDENVASLLQLGKEFGVSRLKFQCENYLHKSTTFNPFIMLHLARQYKLECLLEHSLKEISKIDSIESKPEFIALDCETQNKIMKYIIQRYKKASKTLSQFDVHLCNHHSNEGKNNACCYRAATYTTENERTFLVQMENPESKLTHVFNKAFNCEARELHSVGELN